MVAPNVFGQALRINPLLVIFALLMGGQLAGFVGAFIALPIAAILRETIVYLRRHLALPALGPARPSRRRRQTQTHCPECGVLVAADAEECPACGTELGDRDAAASAAARRARMRVARGRQALRGQARALRDVSFDAARGRARRDHRPQRGRQDDAAADPRGRTGARRAARSTSRRRAGSRSARRSTRKLTVRENLQLFARLEKVADVERGRADARADRARAATRRPASSRAATGSG